MKQLEKYRTFAAAVFGMAGLVYCARSGVHGEDLVAVKWGLGLMVGLVAGRAVGLAAAGGDGITGAVRNVLTASKPGEPPAGGTP